MKKYEHAIEVLEMERDSLLRKADSYEFLKGRKLAKEYRAKAAEFEAAIELLTAAQSLENQLQWHCKTENTEERRQA